MTITDRVAGKKRAVNRPFFVKIIPVYDKKANKSGLSQILTIGMLCVKVMLMENENRHTKFDLLLIALVIIYNGGLLVAATLWLFTDSFYSVKLNLSEKNLFGLNEKATYSLFISGVLGAAFYCLRGMYQRLGEAYTPIGDKPTQPNRILNIKVWIFWYLYRPLQGGVLALVLLSLVNSHLLVSKDVDEKSLSSFYTQIAVGFLAGLGSHELIHKIEEIIKVLFAKSKIASSNSAQKVKENEGRD